MSKKQKHIVGYSFSQITKSEHIADVQHVTLNLTSFNKINPAQELLICSQYTDHSLKNAQEKVQAIRKLGIDHWLDCSYYRTDIDLRFQGNISDNTWYACRVDGSAFNEQNIALMHRLIKLTGDLGCTQNAIGTVLTALHTLKAIEVAYEPSTRIFYPALSSSTLVTESLNAIKIAA